MVFRVSKTCGRRCRGSAAPATGLEQELQAELKDTRQVRTAGAEEVAVGEATGVAGRKSGAAKATGAVVDPVKLRVVEHVVRFGPELEGLRLGECEMLEEAH